MGTRFNLRSFRLWLSCPIYFNKRFNYSYYVCLCASIYTCYGYSSNNERKTSLFCESIIEITYSDCPTIRPLVFLELDHTDIVKSISIILIPRIILGITWKIKEKPLAPWVVNPLQHQRRFPEFPEKF